MSRWERVRAREFRDKGLKKELHHVLERDAILESMGKDAVMDAEEYEEIQKLQRGSVVMGFDRKKCSATGLKELVQRHGIENVRQSFLKMWKPDDDIPMFPEFIIQDEAALGNLQQKFDAAYQKFALDFLRDHLDCITEQSLVGAMENEVFMLTFNRMIDANQNSNN